jgi:hypothetical protein
LRLSLKPPAFSSSVSQAKKTPIDNYRFCTFENQQLPKVVFKASILSIYRLETLMPMEEARGELSYFITYFILQNYHFFLLQYQIYFPTSKQKTIFASSN